MDAPTTTSAGNDTSGDDSGSGGWFTPRVAPRPHRDREGAESSGSTSSSGAVPGSGHASAGVNGQREAPSGRRVSTIRPLGRQETGAGDGTEAGPGSRRTGAPAGSEGEPEAKPQTGTEAESTAEATDATATATATATGAGAGDATGAAVADATVIGTVDATGAAGTTEAGHRVEGTTEAAEAAEAAVQGDAGPTAAAQGDAVPMAADATPGPAPGPPAPGSEAAPGPHGPDEAGPGPHDPGKRTPGLHDPVEAAPGPHDPGKAAPGPVSGPSTTGEAAPRDADASPDAVLIRRTMAEIAPISDKVTSYFYALLFTRHPDLRALFPAAMDTQRDRLLKALLTAVERIDHTEALVSHLRNLGRGHRKYGTLSEHYPAVGECLIGALSRYAGSVWDDETEAAWVRAYTTISQIMIDAAAEDELRAPAWWYAEVVTHDLRTPDIAVITVRPDQPYPFLAGQYTSLETPWWPRIWRHYSFASTPRSDGLLSFHVKAVPAGWVSNALVHRARPGDVLRLGPPAGSMTVDHSTDSGLLCLGGGTGIAPIKALVEDVAEHGRRRPVEVFYGARTDHDLYDIDTMLRLQQNHPWLAVRPIVDNRAFQFPDVVREYGPWNEYVAYLSGPPGMIRSGVDALRDVGMPVGRIRHDSVAELVLAGDQPT